MAKNTKLELFRSEIPDLYSRDNFNKIRDFLRDQPLFKGKFEFFEGTTQVPDPADPEFPFKTQLFPHSLGFLPLDAFITYKSDPLVTIRLNQTLWTNENLSISADGVVSFRMFIGRYEETDV